VAGLWSVGGSEEDCGEAAFSLHELDFNLFFFPQPPLHYAAPR
jgi:hypothetical protein